jgi:hypothetical protein
MNLVASEGHFGNHVPEGINGALQEALDIVLSGERTFAGRVEPLFAGA